MKAKIYKPTRNAMQSGEAKTHHWVLKFVPEERPFIDPLTGWTGMTDMPQQLSMRFASKEAAIAYAEQNGIAYETSEPAAAKTIRPKSYASNFAFTKVS